MAAERPNVSTTNPINYKKWDDLDFESDEDDCHPNIEIGTWRRLKERMRKEKGIVKREPDLRDKWNVTTTNKKYHIDPRKPPKKTEEQEAEKEAKEENQNEDENKPKNDNTNNTNNQSSKPSNNKNDTKESQQNTDNKPSPQKVKQK